MEISPTQDEVVQEYLTNRSYDMNNSVSECRLFVAACRALLVMHPSDWTANNSKVAFNPELWNKELEYARDWYERNNNSAGQGDVHFADFGGFR